MTRPTALCLLFVGAWAVTAAGQPPVGEGPQLSAARGNAGKRLAEAEKRLLAGQAAEAADDLRRLLAEAGDDLVTTDGRHYRPARRVAQAVMAKLPPVELRAYRDRADAPAAALLAAGKRDRDPRPLLELVDQYFASTPAEEGFLWLGELAFERGDFRTAETHWRRLLPAAADSPDPGVIQPKLDPALAAARVALAVVYQGDPGRSAAAVAAFRTASPTATGKLAGHDGVYADTLRAVLANPPVLPPDAGGGGEGWTTFAGDAGRTGHTATPVPKHWRSGGPSWKVPVPVARPPRPVLMPAAVAASTRPVSRHPVVLGGVGYVADASSLFGFDPRTGAERFRYTLPDAEAPPANIDADYLLTAVPSTGRLYARLGPPAVAPPPEKGRSVLACFGPPAQPGAPLEWKFELTPPAGAGVPAAWEAAPAWADGRIYAAFTREANNRLTQAIACYADTGGPPVWVVDVADAAVAGKADARTRAEPVTVADGRVMLCTHAGFVAALDARTGKPAWAYAYPPAVRPTPRPRDICPPVAVGGRVFAAPTDADRLLALDAATGRLLWEVEQIQIDQLLGVAADRLVATIAAPQRGLRGFRVTSGSSREPDGWAIHDDEGLGSYGRGLVSAGAVLWPTKSGVFFARPADGLPLAPHLPGPHGNLAYADGVLLVATPTEVWGYVFEPPFGVFEAPAGPSRPGGLPLVVRAGPSPARPVPVALSGPPMDPDPCPLGPGVAVQSAMPLATPGCVALLPFAAGPTLPGLGTDGGADPLLLVADSRTVYAHRPGERTPAWAAPLPLGVTLTHAHIIQDAFLVAGPGGAALLSKADGAERWHLAWPADAGEWGDFAVASGRLLARAGEHHLIAVDLATGGVAWVRDASGRARFTATPFAFAPAFAAHFAGVDAGVLAQVVPGRRVYLSGATGEVLATAESATGEWPGAPAVFGPGRAAVADGPGTVRAVACGGPTTPMREVWKHEAGGETSLTGRPPAVRAVRAGLLAAFDRNHCVEVDLLTPARGKRVWPQSVWLPPGEIDLERAAAGPLTLFVACQDKLHAVRLADGRPAWTHAAELPGAGPWHVAAGPRGVAVVPVVPPTVDDPGPGLGVVFGRVLFGHAGRLPVLLLAQLEGMTARRVPVVVFDPATGSEVGRVEIASAGPAVGVHLAGPRPVVVTPGVAHWLGSP